jgi:hypothetical protein
MQSGGPITFCSFSISVFGSDHFASALCGNRQDQCTEAGILVENFHRPSQALKSTLNFLGKSPCISLGFSDRDRSLKQVRTLGTLKFRPLRSDLRSDMGHIGTPDFSSLVDHVSMMNIMHILHSIQNVE